MLLIGLQMHDILIARCFHDYGGGDIPVILVQWNEAQIDAACSYWVELSKGTWDEEKKLENCKYTTNSSHTAFSQWL